MKIFDIPTQSCNDHGTSKTVQHIHNDLRRHLLNSSTDTLCPLWKLNPSPSYNRPSSSIPSNQRLHQLVNRHSSVNDVPAADSLVASDDILCDVIPDVLECIHWSIIVVLIIIVCIIESILPHRTLRSYLSLQTSSRDIREAIRSSSCSSRGGIDGLWPIHL